jgi:chitinase
VLSIGGWTWSTDFSTIAASSAARDKFAQDCVMYVQTYGFDGVDLDWEYPSLGGLPSNKYSPDDGKNYVLLLKTIREAFNKLPNADKLIISIAAPAGLDKLAALDISGMAQYLDILNIMSYDFRGGWSSTTGH